MKTLNRINSNVELLTDLYQFEKKESGFLFGSYELIKHTPCVLTDVVKCFQSGIQVIKCIKKKASYYPNPYKIGLLQKGNYKISDLFYMPQSINNLYHGRFKDRPDNHLLLIEHTIDEKYLFITVVENSAHSPYWSQYVKEWERGLFSDKINELRNKLVKAWRL